MQPANPIYGSPATGTATRVPQPWTRSPYPQAWLLVRLEATLTATRCRSPYSTGVSTSRRVGDRGLAPGVKGEQALGDRLPGPTGSLFRGFPTSLRPPAPAGGLGLPGATSAEGLSRALGATSPPPRPALPWPARRATPGSRSPNRGSQGRNLADRNENRQRGSGRFDYDQNVRWPVRLPHPRSPIREPFEIRAQCNSPPEPQRPLLWHVAVVVAFPRPGETCPRARRCGRPCSGEPCTTRWSYADGLHGAAVTLTLRPSLLSRPGLRRGTLIVGRRPVQCPVICDRILHCLAWFYSSGRTFRGNPYPVQINRMLEGIGPGSYRPFRGPERSLRPPATAGGPGPTWRRERLERLQSVRVGEPRRIRTMSR